jgi:hypothetical protein
VQGRRRSRNVDGDPRARDHGRKRAQAVWRALHEEVWREVEQGIEPSQQPLGDYLVQWLSGHQSRLRPTTVRDYDRIIRA